MAGRSLSPILGGQYRRLGPILGATTAESLSEAARQPLSPLGFRPSASEGATQSITP